MEKKLTDAMGKINSRNKGACGERELASVLQKTLGVKARRGRQYCGSPDSPDVVTSIDGVHIECKRVEQFNLYKALDQATNDAGDKIPIVCHRKNRRDWVVVVRLSDLTALSKIICDVVRDVDEKES